MVGVTEGGVVGMTGVGAGTKRGITHRRRKTGGTTVEGEGRPSSDTLTKERKNDKIQVTCELRQSGLVSAFKRMISWDYIRNSLKDTVIHACTIAVFYFCG